MFKHRGASLAERAVGRGGCRGRGKLTAGKMGKHFHGTNEKGKRNTNGINLCLAD